MSLLFLLALATLSTAKDVHRRDERPYDGLSLDPGFEKWLYDDSRGYRWYESYDFSECDISFNRSLDKKPLPWDKKAEVEFCFMKSMWFLSQRFSFPEKHLCDDLLKGHLLSEWQEISGGEKLRLMRCLHVRLQQLKSRRR